MIHDKTCKIHFIDPKTGQKESLLTEKAIWNYDFSILNIEVKIPTKNGLINHDFQISREEFLFKGIYTPITPKSDVGSEISDIDCFSNTVSSEI